MRSKVWVDNLLSKALFLTGFSSSCKLVVDVVFFSFFFFFLFLMSASGDLAASYHLLIPITALISAGTADQRISLL